MHPHNQIRILLVLPASSPEGQFTGLGTRGEPLFQALRRVLFFALDASEHGATLRHEFGGVKGIGDILRP